MIQSLLSSTWSIVLTVIGIIGAVWALYKIAEGIRDVYYQTFPVVTVAGSDPKAPFGLPFSVNNPSGWFSMKDVNWKGVLVEMTDVSNNRFSNNTMLGPTVAEIAPLDTKHYLFPIEGYPSAAVRSLTIDIIINYGVLSYKRQPVNTRFTWRSNQ